MSTSTAWQLARAAAERYHQILEPAILGPFAKALVDFAGVEKGQRVVDVGCGTGAAARYAAEIVGLSGRVVGVDVNAGMIEVAGSLAAVYGAPVEWRVADARQLPLDDGSADVVLGAQSLQFMPEKRPVLLEMQRVAGQPGRVALSLWCQIEENPYFHALVETVAQHIGLETAAGLQSAFTLSDADEIENLLNTAGFGQIEMMIRQLELPLPALTEFVPRHISATPMAAGFSLASETTRQRIVQEMVKKLNSYSQGEVTVIPFRSYLMSCRKDYK